MSHAGHIPKLSKAHFFVNKLGKSAKITQSSDLPVFDSDKPESPKFKNLANILGYAG